MTDTHSVLRDGIIKVYALDGEELEARATLKIDEGVSDADAVRMSSALADLVKAGVRSKRPPKKEPGHETRRRGRTPGGGSRVALSEARLIEVFRQESTIPPDGMNPGEHIWVTRSIIHSHFPDVTKDRLTSALSAAKTKGLIERSADKDNNGQFCWRIPANPATVIRALS